MYCKYQYFGWIKWLHMPVLRTSTIAFWAWQRRFPEFYRTKRKKSIPLLFWYYIQMSSLHFLFLHIIKINIEHVLCKVLTSSINRGFANFTTVCYQHVYLQSIFPVPNTAHYLLCKVWRFDNLCYWKIFYLKISRR